MSAYQEHFDAIKKSVIGQSLPDVQTEVKRAGWSVRVMSVDGRNCIGTADFVANRINVAGGVVTEVRGIG